MKNHYKLLVSLSVFVNVGLAYADCGDTYDKAVTVPAHSNHFMVDWGNNGNHSNRLGMFDSYYIFYCNGPGSLTDWVPVILVENASKSSNTNPDVTVSSYLNNGFGGYWLMDSANLANQDSHYEANFNDFILYNSHQTGTSYYYVLYADNNTDTDVDIHYTICNYYPKKGPGGAEQHWGCGGDKGNRQM